MRLTILATEKMIDKVEVNDHPSMTDPSQNIELRTIVERFVHGLPIPAVGHVLTPDDFDDEDNNYCPPSALDLSEVKDVVDKAQARYEDIVSHASESVSSVNNLSQESPSSPPMSPDGRV